MRYLSYKNIYKEHKLNLPELFIEEVSLTEIAKTIPTPFYCYSKQNILDNFNSFVNSFAEQEINDYKICYAIKANCNLNLVKILANEGAGVDAVSAGEIFRAIKAGIDPKKIVFAGVGKSPEEIAFALKSGVEEFSVESPAELLILNQVAGIIGKKAKFSLRVNPAIDAKTHDKISTGRKTDKFGVDINLAEEIYHQASHLPNLEIFGISMHIGSQITKIEPFERAFSKLRDLCIKLRNAGFAIQNLDFGGGIGILYNNESTLIIGDYAKLIKETTKDLNVKITIAPGRAIIGNAGLLATSTILLKKAGNKNFAIIDAGMNDLMRPGLYDSYHDAISVVKKYGTPQIFDLAGPVCESTDILAKERKFINLKQGDIIAILSAGAYGSSMSNEYNSRPLIPEILVDKDKFTIIRKRPTFEEMIQYEL